VQMRRTYPLFGYDNSIQADNETECIALNENLYHYLQMVVVVAQRLDYIQYTTMLFMKIKQ